MSQDQTDQRERQEESSQSAPESSRSDGAPDVDEASSEEADVAETPEGDASSGGEGDLDPEEKIEALTEKVVALREERDELNDRVLRKAAEFENYRRRMEREKKRRHEAGMLEVIEPILEVLDDFERSLDAAEDLQENQDAETAYESLRGGVEMVFRKFRDTLERLGVEPIQAEGAPFNEELHEAMMRQPSDEVEPGTVLQEIRKGYRMGERVIRHSRVVVAGEPSEDGDANEERDDA